MDAIEVAEDQKREAERLVGRLSDAALAWRPKPGKWSALEHLAHLPRTTRPYLASIAESLERARADGLFGEPPFRGGLIGDWFARSMEPPPRFRTPTFRQLIPPREDTRQRALDDFLASQDELIASLRSAAGVDLGRARFRSPYARLLRLSVDQGYRVILGHNRRHFWHMARIEQDPRRPA